MAETPYPKALLRLPGGMEAAILWRFPLILSPEEVPTPREKDEIVLVSPDYAWIRWAKENGLRALWLNFEKKRCPAAHPLHDLELREPGELQKPFSFRLPDLAEALAILKNRGVPANVVRHCAVVAAVAFFLGERLREKGVQMDPLLAHRAGLVHDLDKIASLGEAEGHGERAAEILAELSYPELGKIVKKHVLRSTSPPKTWEEKVVFLADKMVEGEEVVGISRRIAALRARYPEFHREITAAEPLVRALQNMILLVLGKTKAELLAELRQLDPQLPSAWA